MKLEIQKLCLLCVILVLYVNLVHTQFAKGVIKNNVFYINHTSSGSKDHLYINQNKSNIGYSRNNLNPTMVS